MRGHAEPAIVKDLERDLQNDIGILGISGHADPLLLYSNEARSRSPHRRLSSSDKRSPDRGDRVSRRDDDERTKRDRSPLEKKGGSSDKPPTRVPSSYRRTHNYSKKVSNSRSQLSGPEKERRRQEMMQSAK